MPWHEGRHPVVTRGGCGAQMRYGCDNVVGTPVDSHIFLRVKHWEEDASMVKVKWDGMLNYTMGSFAIPGEHNV